MIPSNFKVANFSPARAASLFHCTVWFDIEQKEGEQYTSWRNEVFAINARFKVVSHASAYKGLRDMIENFCNPKHRLHRSFTRAEIYENFDGTTLYIHNGIEEIKVMETFKPAFVTVPLKIPGKHRILSHFESHLFGKIEVDREKVIDHARKNWLYHGANIKRPAITTNRREMAA